MHITTLKMHTQIYKCHCQAQCTLKVEYHANAEYENPLNNSEKIACVCQRLMYPIMEKNNTSPC